MKESSAHNKQKSAFHQLRQTETIPRFGPVKGLLSGGLNEGQSINPHSHLHP